MQDFLGKELKVGDEVILVHYQKGSSQYLMKGKISEIIKNKIAYIPEWFKGVTSQNIYKI